MELQDSSTKEAAAREAMEDPEIIRQLQTMGLDADPGRQSVQSSSASGRAASKQRAEPKAAPKSEKSQPALKAPSPEELLEEFLRSVGKDEGNSLDGLIEKVTQSVGGVEGLGQQTKASFEVDHLEEQTAPSAACRRLQEMLRREVEAEGGA